MSTATPTPRPDLGIVLEVFVHRRRCGARAANLRARDVFGVALDASASTRRALAADLRALATQLEALDDTNDASPAPDADERDGDHDARDIRNHVDDTDRSDDNDPKEEP